MSGYQVGDFLVSSLIAFVVAYFVRGSPLRMAFFAAASLALATLLVQALVVHRLNFWTPSYLLSSLGALALGVTLALFFKRNRTP